MCVAFLYKRELRHNLRFSFFFFFEKGGLNQILSAGHAEAAHNHCLSWQGVAPRHPTGILPALSHELI